MATISINSAVRFARHSGMMALTLAILFLSVHKASAQQDPPPPGQTRKALRQAIDLYNAKNYEKAAEFFAYAQTGQQALSPADQKDLADLSMQNNIALKGRQDGVAQLRLAEDALKQNRTQDVGNLIKSLNSNQFLTPAESQQVGELSKKLQAQSALAAPPTGKADVKSLLAAGRAALQAGDFAGAEVLATQADRAGSLFPNIFQSDSPAKLRRDIQTAKTKAQPPTPPDAMPKNPETTGADPKASTTSKFMGMTLWPFGGGSPAAKKDELSPDGKAGMARQMVKDGFLFLNQANQIDMARMCAIKAKELNVPYGPNEQTPDMLLHEIQRRQGGTVAPVDPPTPIAQAKPTEAPTNADPRALLKQGRALLAQKKHEEADKVCGQALAANAKWGLFEDTPEKLRKDILRARQSWERDESVRLMVEARKQFAAGSIEDAEKNAYKAKQMHGPYGVFDYGDRPQKLIDEIQRTKQARGPAVPNNDKLVGPKDTSIAKTVPPLDVLPAGIQNANKNRAIVMVREARELERQNLLFDARQKASEAREMRATFAPDEDSPDNVMLSLTAKCDREILAHLQQAIQCVSSASDPERFVKANEKILSAKKLAFAFQMDGSRISQTEYQVQQVANGGLPKLPPSLNTLVAQPPSTGDPHKDQVRKLALEKLQAAQVELSYGKTTQARKMAEELYRPEYGIQEDVLRLIRSISAEEYNQQILEAKRTFDAGLDAFLKNKYSTAMEVFQNIDPLMLPEQYQARLRDIMSTRDMQPHKVQQAKGNTFIGRTQIDPKTKPDDSATEPSMLDQARAEEMVRFQAMRQRGQDVLRNSSDLYKNEQKDQAIDTLNRYLDQVKLEQFEQQKANELRRLPEARIQQFRAMLNEEKLKGITNTGQYASNWDEAGNQRKKKAQQDEVFAKMKLVTELMKQNKLKEAEVEVRKIREIDPTNLAADAALNIITTRRLQDDVNQEIVSKQNFFIEGLKSDPGIALDMNNPISFAKGRPIRDKNSGEIRHDLLGPKEKAIEYRLRQPISFNFKDVPLAKAIEDLTVLSGVPVMIDRKALRDAKINLESPLTFSAPNIDMKSALKLMLKDVDLTYTIQDQVLLITTLEYTIGRLVRVTYPVADLIVVVPDHPLPDVLNMVKALESSMRPPNYMQGGYGGAGGSPFPYAGGEAVSSHSGGLGSAYGSRGGQGQGGQGAAPKDRSKDAMAEVLKGLIQDTVAKNTWEAMGGTGNIQYFPFGMALVINQPQEVQEEVALLLATLRRLQDLQVSVELRAVVVSETFFERIGVDFNMNIAAPKRAGTNDLLAGNIQAASQKGAISGLNAAGTLTPDLGFPINNHSFNFTTPAFGGYQPEAGLSLGLAFLSDIQVFMFLEAVQGDRRAHIMQAPKITVFNGQQANISGTVSRPVVTQLTPFPTPDGNMIMVPFAQQMPFGLAMTVQPVVSPDRRFIRLNVTPILAAGIIDPAGALVTAVPGAGNNPPLANNPLSVQVQINPQASSLQIANTTVNVPDGGTVLLGGFKFLAEERTEYGPPVLSKIPYLSRLFRNVGWSRDGATLIYLVTARVIMVEEEERIFMGELQPIPR